MPSCPFCGFTAAANTKIAGSTTRPPQPGDLMVCSQCQSFLRFDPDLALIELTAAEIEQLPEIHRKSLQAVRTTFANLQRRTQVKDH